LNFVSTEKGDSKSITVPITSPGKYRPCPHYIPTHTFQSVQEILDIFPFISNLIFPHESFKVEGVEIHAWDPLYIVDKVS